MHPCEEKKDGCREFLTLPRTCKHVYASWSFLAFLFLFQSVGLLPQKVDISDIYVSLHSLSKMNNLAERSPVLSFQLFFFQTIEYIAITRKLNFYHNPWQILQLKSETCLVIVIVRYNCNIQNRFVHPNTGTVWTEFWNLHLWSDDSSNETENRMCTFNNIAFIIQN